MSKTIRELMNEELPSKTMQRKRTYRPSVREVRSIYRLLNTELFKDQLIIPKIILQDRLMGSWGECVGEHIKFSDKRSRCTITLASSWFCKQWLITCLAHEMVHQYQWDIWGKIREKNGQPALLSHGPSFYFFKNRFSKANIPLKDSYSSAKWFKHQDMMKV